MFIICHRATNATDNFLLDTETKFPKGQHYSWLVDEQAAIWKLSCL